MERVLIRGLYLLIICLLFFVKPVLAQTITIGAVDAGPYAPGSTISVPVSMTGTCVTTTTTYNLYLSDAGGSFAAQKLIGSFPSFYTTFVNGVIPAGTPAGTGYLVRVVAVNPSVTSSNSPAFTINSGTGVNAAVSSLLLNPAYTDVFGSCIGVNNMSYSFVNKSTAGSAVTAAFFNEQTQALEATITPTAAGVNFNAKAAQYTITVKAVANGIVGTHAYFLVNNSVNNSFGTTGSNTICLANGGLLSYNVDISSASGVQKNFPGLIYNIKWGDNATSMFTLCDIIAAGGKISHNYNRSSCGRNPNGQHNAFEVDLQPSDIYCGNVGTQVTSYAQVVTPPHNMFTPYVAVCANTPVVFSNLSDPGQDPNNTTKQCKSANAEYTWIVDGITKATNLTIDKNFTTTFTTTGMHSITLHLQNSTALCTANDTTQSFCVQNAPQPKFTLPVTAGCAPLYITPSNQSVIDSNCNNSNQYLWVLTGPNGVSYLNKTNQNSRQPQFVFKNSGLYTLKLNIVTVSCGVISAPAQTIIVDSVAVAKLSPDTTLCGSNQILNFNAAKGPSQTLLTGDGQNVPGTYLWNVTGGNYSYLAGTSDTSKYPQIKFTDFSTYTISVSNSNTCGPTATAVQHITFKQAPTVSAGDSISYCSKAPLVLNGSVTGGASSTIWQGGSGTFNPGRNVLNPAYTPSTAEVNAGKLTLTLVAATNLASPCDSIKSSVVITITKPDSITSAPAVTVCSGGAVNYAITAILPKSTFTWTVDKSKTTATASGYAASGSGTIINDVVANSDLANYAIVTYDITAAGGTGCQSNTFALTVSIAPKQPLAKFTQSTANGCDSLNVQFTNTSLPANGVLSWDFGDGSPVSHATNPLHTFAPRTDGKDTVYNVSLSSVSSCGAAIPYISTVTVRPKIPVAFISPVQIVGCSPFTLAVNNFSPGTNKSYTYYLYNDTTLVQQITTTDKGQVRFAPITVASTKVYSLYMVATGLCGTTGQSTIIPITISANNVIAQMFLENGTSKGCVPFTANFINNSIGADNYYYNIYDVNHQVVDRRQGGTAPLAYTFNTPGTFYVTITAGNSCTTVESGPPLRVDVYAIPKPVFFADDTVGCKRILVNFTNQTQGDPTIEASSYLYDWDFGDGSAHSFSFTPQPHVYTYKNSPFTVTLTVTNPVTSCVTVVKKTAYINITAPSISQFTENPDSTNTVPNYHFTFDDQSTGSPNSWTWDFGDGTGSTTENPEHTYRDTGYFKVSLTTTNPLGCDSTIVHLVRITGVPGSLYLPNAFEPLSGTEELRTFMAKGSGIKQWHLQIFNNFSQLIWETTKLDDKGAPAESWDGTFKGTPVQQGVYVWQASATFINGTEWSGNTYGKGLPKRTGTINLIR